MTKRQPGDCVVNAELTDEQRERFVRDCVAAGAEDDSVNATEYELTLWANDDISDVSGYPVECMECDGVNNVTHEYKDNPMTQADLMRQIADAMERNPDGWWREFERYMQIERRWEQCGWAASVLDFISNGSVRPKPRTYTLHVEDMPEPMREEPKHGTEYWVILPGSFDWPKKQSWCNASVNKEWLNAGLCYPDEPTAREALEKLTRAMGGE